MPATVTLATATLTNGIGPGTSEITLSDVSGVFPGYGLFIDSELFKVREKVAGTSRVVVSRGQGGTAAANHSSSATVYIGRQDQFYSTDPVGAPDVVIQVSPYINVTNGKIWYSQGDAGPGQVARWWEPLITVRDVTSLGVRAEESSPTSST